MEQSCVQKYVPVALLSLGIAAVHIHHISKQLEGVEGNADGQGNAANEIRNGAEDGDEQAGIFEIADQSDIHHRRKGDPAAFVVAALGSGDLQRTEPGYQRHEHQQENVLRFTPCIEDQGEDQKNDVLSPLRPAQGISSQRQGEKGI